MTGLPYEPLEGYRRHRWAISEDANVPSGERPQLMRPQAARMEAVLPQNDSETTVQAGIGSPGRRARVATESRSHEALASDCDRAHVARFRCFGTTQGLS